MNAKRDSQWKAAVLERDKWTCQNCGRTTNLDAAHITARTTPELRWSISNGVTLCRYCHDFYHQFPSRWFCFVAAWRLGVTLHDDQPSPDYERL